MFSCTQRRPTAQEKDSELILTLKMKTRHHVGGPFSREFSACVIIADDGLKSQDLEILSAILRFFLEKRLTVKFSKFCSESFYRLIYRTKNAISTSSQTVANAHIVPKVCQGQTPTLAQNIQNFIQIGSLSAKL